MKISLFILCLLIYIPVFCQEEKPTEPQKKAVHSLGISFGVNDFHFRDEYLSPHIFSKSLFSTQLSYQIRSKHYLHNIDVDFSTGHPNSEIQPRNVSENIGSVSYTISRVIDAGHIAGKPLELSLGAGISSNIVSTEFDAEDKKYSYVWDEQSWYCSNSLNLHLKGEYQLSKKSCFSMQFALPLFGLVSRPENGHSFNAENAKVINHFLNVEVQGKPEFFWDNASLSCKLGFKQQIGSGCNLKVDYFFNYITSDRPAPVQMYMNRFMVGFEFLL